MTIYHDSGKTREVNEITGEDYAVPRSFRSRLTKGQLDDMFTRIDAAMEERKRRYLEKCAAEGYQPLFTMINRIREAE